MKGGGGGGRPAADRRSRTCGHPARAEAETAAVRGSRGGCCWGWRPRGGGGGGMNKAERLNERVQELLLSAVHEVLQAVRETVCDYEERRAHTQRENQALRLRVEELQKQLQQQQHAAALQIAVQIPVSPPATCSRHHEPPPPRDSLFKEEPLGEPQSTSYPQGIKAETEQPSSQEREDPVDFFPCTEPDFPVPPNEPNFSPPPPPPCGAAPEALELPTEQFPYEDDSWRAQSRGERHTCVLCGKTFNRLANLRIHQRCHTGEKPYACTHCGRRFSHSGNLQKHKRVHTGERPYHCPQCSKSFSQSSHLKKHQTVHMSRHGNARRNPDF